MHRHRITHVHGCIHVHTHRYAPHVHTPRHTCAPQCIHLRLGWSRVHPALSHGALTATGVTEDSPHHPFSPARPGGPRGPSSPWQEGQTEIQVTWAQELTSFAPQKLQSRGGKWAQGSRSRLTGDPAAPMEPTMPLKNFEGPGERRDCGSVLAGPQKLRAGSRQLFLAGQPPRPTHRLSFGSRHA